MGEKSRRKAEKTLKLLIKNSCTIAPKILNTENKRFQHGIIWKLTKFSQLIMDFVQICIKKIFLQKSNALIYLSVVRNDVKRFYNDVDNRGNKVAAN